MCEKMFSVTILKEMQNFKKGFCFDSFFFYDTVIGGMSKIKLVLSHMLIEGNLATYTKDRSNIHVPIPNNLISENLFHTYNPNT